MNRQDQQTYKRAVFASLLGLGVQVIVAAGLAILAMYTGNASIGAAAWHAFGGLGLWLCLAIVYQQHKLSEIEALEAEQLALRHGADSSIFQTNADDLAVAARRLTWLYKWLVPLTGVFTAIYLIGIGIMLVLRSPVELGKTGDASSLPLNPGMTLTICFGLGFVAFLISRYIAGMAKAKHWQMLRGGAGYLMGGVLVAAMLVTTLAFQHFEIPLPLRYMSVAIPVLMIIIGAELILNLILDFYRPRRPGEAPRPAFDSRLLSLLTSPESIAKTINEAINYQFGFEITRSWFWQLLSRAFGWLVVFGAVVMMLFSSIIVVEPYQQAIALNFGRRTGEPLQPGIHFKAPWPIGTVQYYDVTTIRDLPIGSVEEHKPGEPILWATSHSTIKPENLIVASPRTAQRAANSAERDAAVPEKDKAPENISVVNAEITLYYRIDPAKLLDFINANADADKIIDEDRLDRLRNLAIAQVSRYMLRSDVDAWIGPERGRAGVALQKSIQEEADRAKLGVQIVSVAVASVHPPQEAAESFHEVVKGELEKQTKLRKAHQDATQILAATAGSADRADRIMEQINHIESLKVKESKAAADPAEAAKLQAEIATQTQALEQLLLQAGGYAATTIADARGYRWEKENGERGKSERFAQQVQAYKLAPEYYKARRFYEVLQESMPAARKYILVGDSTNLTVRADLKDIDSKMGEIFSEQEAKAKKP